MRSLPRIRISPYTVTFALILTFLDRSFLSLIPMIAALCHELGHIAVIYVLGADVREVEITMFGAEIRSDMWNSSPLENIAVYAAGGAANLLSAFAVYAFSDSLYAEFFVGCSAALALLNFLPIRTLDGGCIAEELFCLAFPRRGRFLFSVLSSFTLGLLWLLAVFLLLNAGGNISLLLFCVYMFCSLYFK